MYASNEEEDWVYLHETPSLKNVSKRVVSRADSASSKSDRTSSIEVFDVDQEDCVLSSADTQDDLERENRLLEVTNTDETSLLSSRYIPSQQSIGTSTTDDRESITSIPQKNKSWKHFRWQPNNSDTLVSCTCLLVLFTLPFLFGQILIQRNRSSMVEIARELQKTNERLDEIKVVSIGNFERTLTAQFEQKLQTIINQQMTWYEHEKSALVSQIQSLQAILSQTERNFTDTIEQLTNENTRLKQQIKLHEQPQINDPKTCLPGVNCTQSSRSTLDKLVSNLFKRTASIAVDTSGNLSSFFERLSASVSKIVDDRHEYLTKSKRKLTNLTNGKIPRSSRGNLDNFSSSFRQAKTSYASWIKTRAQARMRTFLKPNRKFPWRWTFSRGPSNLRMFPELSTKGQVCSSKFDFPLNGICSMKNWMSKFFR